MRHRPLATAAAAALVLGALAGPAAARGTAVDAQPAVGTATSALSLLTLALADHSAELGRVALTSDTVTGNPVAKIVVTPLKVDGVAYGEQTVTPASSPASVPAVDSATVVPSALAGLIGAKSPVIDANVSTADGASSKAGAASLGSVSVLGIPLALDGTVDVSSVVNSTNALGQKTVVVENLALPSVADLLAALGLNLPALPVETLTKLLTDLGLVNTAVTTAQQALDAASAGIQAQIDAAQKAVDDAAAALTAKTDELTAAQSQLRQKEAELATALAPLAPLTAAVTTAQANLASANTALTAANAQLASVNSQINGLISVLLPTSAAVLAANPALAASLTAAQTAVATAQTAVNDATAALAAATAALAAASGPADVLQAAVDLLKATVATLQTAVDGLQKTLDDLINALKLILGNVQPQLDALIGAITAVLDGTPLVSIDSITVQTQALVTSATTGGQVSKVTGGEIVGLKVLGTDVLQNVLGNTKIDLLSLVGSTLSQVTSTINGLTGTLSSVLSNVPAFPSLSIPAPQIGVLTKTTATSVAGGFGLAENSVKALSVTIPAITLPAALALPNAASLPAISGLPTAGVVSAAAVGDLLSKPITLSLGTLAEQSRFRPAVTAAPGQAPGTVAPGESPQLPTTGLPAGVALTAMLLVGTGLLMRRRTAADV